MATPKKDYKVPMKENMQYYFGLLSNYKGIALLGLIVVMLLQIATVGENFLFKAIIDNAERFTSGLMPKSAFLDSLLLLGILFALILIVKVVGAWFRLYAVNHLDAKLMRDLKQKFFNHLIYLSHKFHSEKKTGSIISRITRGSRSIEVITDVIIFQCCPYYLDFH